MSALRWIMLLVVLLISVPTVGQSDTVACEVLQGARVHLPEGPADGALVVLVGDRIADAGLRIAGLTELDDGRISYKGRLCTLSDVGGKVVTAGLIDPSTALGLVEVSLEARTRDTEWEGADPVRASLRVSDAYNPRSTLIPIARLQGVTSAVVVPSGGLVAGQGGWVDLAGGTQAESVIAPSVAVYANLRATSSRAASLRLLAEALDDARFYGRNRRAHEQNRLARDFSAALPDLLALGAVVDGSVPLVVPADRASDIEALLRFAESQGIRLVVSGGAEAWLLRDQLAAAGVPVIVDPMVYGPGSFDQVEGRPDNAALLDAAGVPVLLSTWSSHFTRTLRQRAGNAVRGGLGHSAALRAITETPARVFGQADRGRIAPGARANLVVWTGDPLEISTSVERLVIGGNDVSLVSRQTELRDRYRDQPGIPLPPLPLPE
ncbi:MAG: imidazolonepropionase [Deltaproteobacteria bacterium]|nr:imidazolonepropionase [Deltaproteobacteria bacterium]